MSELSAFPPMGGTFASCQTQRDLCWVVLKNFVIFEGSNRGSSLIKIKKLLISNLRNRFKSNFGVWGFYNVFRIKIFDPKITIFQNLIMIHFYVTIFVCTFLITIFYQKFIKFLLKNICLI